MIEGELTAESSGSVHKSRWRRGGLRWVDVSVSAFLQLVVAAPTMAVEESWHGHPMIDQPGSLWLVAACLVAATFLAGGAVTGYRLPFAATVNATAAATLAVGLLLVGALIRRVWLVHEGVPAAVVALWCLGTVAALLLSVVGSWLGRRFAANSP